MEEKYNQKELLIFNAFKEIIESNSNIENIKVADIAKAAKIGKGTIYEYFQSKEEIIAKSIVYILKIDIKDIIDIINKISTFKEQCYKLFNYCIRSSKYILSSLKILYNHVISNELNNVLAEECREILEIQTQFCNLLDYIINTGIEENIINKNLDRDYDRYVFISSCSGLVCKLNKEKNTLEEDYIKNQVNFAYTLITKSLS